MPKGKVLLTKTIYLFTLIAGCFLACADCSLAHKRLGHIKIWEMVLGLEHNQSILKPFWKKACDVLDRYQGAEQELIERFPWYVGGPRYHRLLFHWGFNVDPKEHEPLRKHVEEKYDEYREKLIAEFRNNSVVSFEKLKQYTLFEKLPTAIYVLALGDSKSALETQDSLRNFIDSQKWEQMDLFWDFLRSYQGWSESSVKNRTLIEAVEEFLLLEGRPARGLATLIYDIHVLADYETSQTEYLGDISLLKKDITELGVRRLIGPLTWAEYKPMFDPLIFDWDDHNPVHANQLMKLLELILPEILHSSPYRELLERRGIKLKDIRSPYNKPAY